MRQLAWPALAALALVFSTVAVAEGPGKYTVSGTNVKDKSEYHGTATLSSRPKEFHLRALPEPCVTLSSHTAPDVRPLP